MSGAAGCCWVLHLEEEEEVSGKPVSTSSATTHICSSLSYVYMSHIANLILGNTSQNTEKLVQTFLQPIYNLQKLSKRLNQLF